MSEYVRDVIKIYYKQDKVFIISSFLSVTFGRSPTYIQNLKVIATSDDCNYVVMLFERYVLLIELAENSRY